ncbi:hypothetical protein MTP99_012125 [Tenebrio molitor]|jgi:hypothetical protein|uniref:uncharacterized protein n=1 Tax=Tenebrio molitor TaxID=7067 RepID=UPI001C3A1531|nr:hypothetical protein MTP99_012125 [Tenebrio molitor]CAH1370563.1 unnamed protein product [Tenebrio molitor]
MELIILLTLACLAHGGVISHDAGIDHHERATSYQNIHIEHFHPVPTYIRKEDKHLLEHPISLGTSSSKVEVHHGDKHDHGYAFASAENNAHGHGFEGFDEGLASSGGGGHEAALAANYQVQDQGDEYAQYQGHSGQAGAGLGHYQLSSDVQGYPGVEGHVQVYDDHES